MKSAGWLLVCAVAFVVPSMGQDGPVLLPRTKSVHPSSTPKASAPSATLHVACDLGCELRVDSELKATARPGIAARIVVAAGVSHILSATTLDGLDKFETTINYPAHSAYDVRITLRPARDARLAEQNQKMKAEELRKREERAREAETANTWTDSGTHLTWLRVDNGRDVSLYEANQFCSQLTYASRQWRLPTIDELQGLYEPQAIPRGFHIKGEIRLSGWSWSVTPLAEPGRAWAFLFTDGTRKPVALFYRAFGRALCVSDAGTLHSVPEFVLRLTKSGDETWRKAEEAYKNRQYNAAADNYRKACDEDILQACYSLGFQYRVGQGVAVDESRAVALLQRSCDGKVYSACTNLGLIYRDHRNWSEALNLLTQACNQREYDACTEIGDMYREKKGVPRDPEKAVSYYQESCDGNDMNGCARLGQAYLDGHGVSKDPEKARQLLSRACEQQIDSACKQLLHIH